MMTSPIARTIAATVAATALLGGPVAAVAASATPTPTRSVVAVSTVDHRGALVSLTHVQRQSVAQIRANLRANGVDPARVRYATDAWRVVYRTVDVHGAPTTASGLIVLPRNDAGRLRVVSYAHGTMAPRSAAPSVDDHARSTEGMTLASAGYAAVEPDYLGLGLGPGRHPYLDSATEQSASVDMLRAAFAAAPRLHRQLDRDVLVTGFSQGGKVAMLLGQALQAGAVPGARLAGLAPISGPYDLLGAELPAIFDRTLSQTEATYYLTYLLTAWDRLYHLYDRPSEAFRQPYDTTLAPLFDGHHDDSEIGQRLAPSPEKLLTPAFLRLVKHPTGRLAAALWANDNSCRDWRPRVPVRLLASSGDEVVSMRNTLSCERMLRSNGARVQTVDLGHLSHNDSGRHGLFAALNYFLEVSPPSK